MSTRTVLRKRADGGLEHVVENVEPKPVTVEQAIAMVRATCKRLENVRPADPNEGRVVTGMFLTPRGLGDKNGGKIVKAVRVGPKPRREFAQPTPHFDAAQAARLAVEDELAKLLLELKDLDRVVADPATSVADRERATIRLTAVRGRIEAIETALHPKPPAGEAPTAGA